MSEDKSKTDHFMTEDQRIEAIFRENVANIVPVELESEMKTSFIDYAMSVITDRALPDVRDGLKPVHRRILYSMFTQGFTPEKPHRKCATTVGDVLGRFHPHGDAAVYDSLVRLAQDFSMRYTLVDGHGNFGSRDGDAPAAYRYTEARLTRIAIEMMNDINKNTVDFQPNFDEHEMEPAVLPAHFPNLLVNGSTGIAVGMATHIPPHNLGDVIEGAIHLLNNPDATVDDLMRFVPGPDFPTGGLILGTDGIRSMYTTGRGKIVVRANCEIEEAPNGRQRIVVRDLPYMVNKAKLIQKIAELVKNKRLEGISYVRDESDRNEAVRIVIEIKRDSNANVVLNRLYRMTQLQDNFNANVLALVPDGGPLVPKLINLHDALHYYNEHAKEVTTRRTQFELEKTEARKHIVEGLRVAIANIDEVVRIIRASKNEDDAKTRLSERFGFSERQAQHIVDMRLGRLTGLERDKLEAEYADLLSKIEYYLEILQNESRLIEVIIEEMNALKDKYNDEHRTQIDVAGGEITDESLIKEELVVVTMTHFGYIKRQPTDTYSKQHRGGRGIIGLHMREDDFVQMLITSHTHDYLLFFTEKGRVFRLKTYQIPEESRQARGLPVVNLLQLDPDDRIETVIPIVRDEHYEYLIMATRNGLVKRTAVSQFKNINRAGLIAIDLREGDELIGVTHSSGKDDLQLITKQGFGIRFSESDVRPTGRNTMGVKGITLNEDDEVISMVRVIDAEERVKELNGEEDSANLMFVSEFGFGKRTNYDEFRVQRRGGKGLIAYKPSSKTGDLVAALSISDQEDAVMIDEAGLIIRIAATEISTLGRTARGVTLMRSRTGKVVDVTVVEHEETDDFEMAEDEFTTEQAEPDMREVSEEAQSSVLLPSDGLDDHETNDEETDN